ncbi:2-methylaconitate cis-trans isomerase PrpF family protein [Lacrimispora sp. JR3]|mgnify:CR=1 FL=1|uniref:2-methylaconitate cis-trans isomerase PrpF family protein n=1 Tax=Lacrimispora sinapis TaxID=3111456 RepID=UPI003749E689
MKELKCSIYRGGTSKGVFLLEEDLKSLSDDLDHVLLKVMGSPDLHQIDGLGGAVSTTSKVAIISKETENPWDVNYTFAQVSVDKPVVSYAGNCGNISSAVGIFAIENKLVEIKDPVTVVKIYNTNTKKVIEERIPTPNGELVYTEDYKIAGVPGKGLKIDLKFLNPAGSLTGKLLPTGNKTDLLQVDGVGQVEVSIVDASNPLVYVDARTLGLTGYEKVSDIDSNKELLDQLERIRGMAAMKMGLIRDLEKSSTESPGVPKLTLVAPPKDYYTVEGELVKESDYDLSVRMMSMQKAHKSIALTGALCTFAACAIPDTIPNRLVKKQAGESQKNTFDLGHSSGIIGGSIEYKALDEENIEVQSVTSFRTARKILTGTVYFV